jgi:hypothetical protein
MGWETGNLHLGIAPTWKRKTATGLCTRPEK